MSAPQPASHEPHGDEVQPQPAAAPTLRAVPEAPAAPETAPAASSAEKVAAPRKAKAPAKPRAAKPVAARTAAKPAAKPRAASTAKARAASTAKSAPTKTSSAKAGTAKPAAKRTSAAAKPAAAKAKPAAAQAKPAASGTAKPRAKSTAAAKPRAPRRTAAAWPTAMPQATTVEPITPVRAEAPEPPRPVIERRHVVRPEPAVAAAPQARVAQAAPVAPQPARVTPQPAPVAHQPAPVAPAAPVAPQAAPVAPQPVVQAAPVAPRPVAHPAPVAQPTAPAPVAGPPQAYVPTQPPAAYTTPQPAPVQQPALAPQPAPIQHTAPAPQPTPIQHAAPAPAPQHAPAQHTAPAPAPQPAPVQNAAPAPQPAPVAQATPAPQPVSLAGGDVPAMLLPQQPSARAARPVTPPSVPATPPPATHAATPAAYTPAPAPAAPAPYDHAAPEHDEDPSSKAPPGFTGEAIRAAESPTLLALDPVDDETTRPVAVVAPPETIGGSALLAKLLSLVPKRSDFKAFGGSRESTVRVALTVLVSALLVAFLLPAIGRALQDTPVVGTMVHQLQSLGLYPKAYGVPFIAAALSVISAMGILVAQMEKTAHEQERRDDPVVRLNIGLAALVAATLAAGAYTVLRSHGWAAGASAFGFFIGTCLLVPVANTPGARAMRHQPARAWALIFVLSAAGFAISPSIPGALIALLTFTHVRLNWGAVSRGDDDFRDGPIDATNRLSALLIMIVVLIATAVGTHAMTLSPDAVRQTYVNPDVSSQPELRGIDVGPSVKPPSNTP